MKISERILEIRKNNHLTRVEFGKRIGISQDAVANIEYDRNKKGVPDNIIKLISVTFNVNEEWLRTGKGEMFNYSEDNLLIEKLSAEYKLDSFQKKLVQKYLELTEQQKNAVKSFLDRVYEEEFANPQSSENITDEISATEEDSDTKKKPEEFPLEYKNMSTEELLNQANMIENLLEKRQAEELSSLTNIKNA